MCVREEAWLAFVRFFLLGNRVSPVRCVVVYVRVEIESIADGIDFSGTLTRASFEELNDSLFKKTLSPLTAILTDTGMKKHEIDEVVLVGGSTRYVICALWNCGATVMSERLFARFVWQ